MREREGTQRSLEERTAAFFNQPYDAVAAQLLGRTVVLAGTDKKIIVTNAEPWSRVGNRYKAIEQLKPGEFWSFDLKLRKMQQALISTEPSMSCVRIVRASSYDPEKDTFLPMPREGDVATYFGLEKDEVARLEFKDESDRLYLVREGRHLEQQVRSPQGITSEEANIQLRRLLDEA